jgi:hypothetical protein
MRNELRKFDGKGDVDKFVSEAAAYSSKQTLEHDGLGELLAKLAALVVECVLDELDPGPSLQGF